MRYNVARGEGAYKIKKDGTLSKIKDVAKTYTSGNIIVTNFGEFMAVRAEQRIHISRSGRQYKVWFVTLKDAQGNIFTIKHDQAKNNKNIPRTVRLINQLLLAEPKELIDILLEEANRKAAILYPDNPILCNFEEGQIAFKKCNGIPLSDMFVEKFAFIHNVLAREPEVKETLCRQLLTYYHPDRSSYPIEYTQAITEVLTNIRRNRVS